MYVARGNCANSVRYVGFAVRACMQKRGSLKLGSSGLKWTSQAGREVEIAAEDMARAQWSPLGSYCQLTVVLKNGSSANFEGFDDDVSAARFFAC